ncbi:rhomboid family intramembrane serine protease [Thalassobaculum sp.]|uniref:rhomboid family intramembrane serine protease n=1 Tax=Thalassobaculum sp. TaxID=2022740 RepID=UPI0032EC72FF
MSRIPIATLAVAFALTAVFVWQFRLDAYQDMQAILALGVVPAHLWGLRIPAPQIDLVPPIATLVTAQWLHGGAGHLIGNLAALLFVGPPAEARTGPWRLLAVFLIAGVAGLAVEATATPSSTIPILGASASVAGLIGAAARRAPHARVALALPARTRGGRFGLRRLAVPVLPLVAVWLIFQVAGIAFEEGEPVAFLAHATGFVTGALLAGSNRRDRDGGREGG